MELISHQTRKGQLSKRLVDRRNGVGRQASGRRGKRRRGADFTPCARPASTPCVERAADLAPLLEGLGHIGRRYPSRSEVIRDLLSRLEWPLVLRNEAWKREA